MDPWQVTTIALATVIVLAGLYVSGMLPRLAGSPAGNIANTYSSIFITFLSNFLPFAIFTAGFISDIIHLEWRSSIPGLAGLVAVVLIKFVTSFTTFGLTTSDNSATSWCTIPGLESLENPILPMAFVLTSTILFYYTYWTGHPGSPSVNVFAIITGVILLIQMVSFSISGNCQDYYYLIPGPLGIAGNVIAAVAVGATVAGVAYLGVSAQTKFRGGDYNPFLRGPSSTGASGPSPAPDIPASGGKCANGTDAVKTPSGKRGCPTSSLVCPDGSKAFREGTRLFCPPVSYGMNQSSAQPSVGEDGDIYVLADLYKNGQLVTESISK